MSAPVKVHARADDEWYVEPQWATALLLEHEQFGPVVWDPACGGGNICRAVIASGRQAMGTDIVRRAEGSDDAWWLGFGDFLTGDLVEDFAPSFDIITNPPFFRAAGTESFIRRALGGTAAKVAVFTDVKFLASQRRAAGLFVDHPPSRVWIHAKRPSCPPGEFIAAGNEAKGGTADWCWLVWDQQAAPGLTQLGWLRGEVAP